LNEVQRRQIGNELVKLLVARSEQFRLVGRNPKAIRGVETLAADLTDKDQTIQAVAGSTVVRRISVTAGATYGSRLFQESFIDVKRLLHAIQCCRSCMAFSMRIRIEASNLQKSVKRAGLRQPRSGAARLRRRDVPRLSYG